MTSAMTASEREAFLAGVHVGVLSVADPGRGPLTVPVWYAYEPGGTLDVVTGGDSVKAQRFRPRQGASRCAPRASSRPTAMSASKDPSRVRTASVSVAERRALAHRYLGAELGDQYLAATEAEAATNVAFRMSPAHWRTVDYAKQFI